APAADVLQHGLHAAAECGTGLEPVAHRRLVAVVDLDVLQAWNLLRDDVEVVAHLLRRDARAEAIPRAPAGWRRRKSQTRMRSVQARRQRAEQRAAIPARRVGKLF